MMVHPYVRGGQLDRQAIEAANQRTVYYGTLGFIDPRTYTLDVYMIRKVSKQSWKATLGLSVQAAAYGAAFGAVMGYLGYDPLNVTPGYGMSLEGGTVTLDGVPAKPVELLFDSRQYYM